MKLPAIQFYPGDWRKDVGVQSLTFHDRGVWFEMLMLMHESPVRGKLFLGTKAMPDEVLASLFRLDLESLKATIAILIERGVTERDSTGALVSRRMLRDEDGRAEDREKMNGWRKAKKLKNNGNEPVTEMLPLSSSSTSSSTSIKNNYGSLTLPDWLKPEIWDAFVESRKKLKKPMTEHAQEIALRKLVKAYDDGYDAIAALELTIERGWQGVFINDQTPKRKVEWKVVGDSVEERAAYWGTDNAIGKAILAGGKA